MSRFVRFGAAGFAAALAVGASALPAHGADTPATFSIAAGTLAISVPAGPVDLGSVSPSALTLSGSLGNVTVTDTRGALTSAWTVTVSSSQFVTGSGAAAEKVTPDRIAYASGIPTSTTGVGAFAPGTAASLDVTVAAASRVGAAWAGTADSTATWNPTITFALLAQQVAGTYSGTITHSVA